MRNIKNAWKVLSRLCVVLVFVIVLESVVKYCYEDWYSTAVVRLSKLERKELQGTLDTIYCGSSVAYYAIDPLYLDEKTGSNSFNLATSAQPLIGSYCLIRETAEQNPVRQVYQVVTIPAFKKIRGFKSYMASYSSLNSWKWRLYYLAAMHNEKMILSALAYSTNVETYSQWAKIRVNIAHKKDPYLDVVRYGGRGYRAGYTEEFDGATDEVPYRSSRYWDGDEGDAQVEESSLAYLKKAVEFCKENGINYTLVMLPLPQEGIEISGDLDGFNQYLRGLAEELDIDLYNFQLYKDRQKLFTDDKFRDIQHMNDTGGKLFSEIFAEVLNSDHPEEYFYDSMKEFAQEAS